MLPAVLITPVLNKFPPVILPVPEIDPAPLPVEINAFQYTFPVALIRPRL